MSDEPHVSDADDDAFKIVGLKLLWPSATTLHTMPEPPEEDQEPTAAQLGMWTTCSRPAGPDDAYSHTFSGEPAPWGCERDGHFYVVGCNSCVHCHEPLTDMTEKDYLARLRKEAE